MFKIKCGCWLTTIKISLNGKKILFLVFKKAIERLSNISEVEKKSEISQYLEHYLNGISRIHEKYLLVETSHKQSFGYFAMKMESLLLSLVLLWFPTRPPPPPPHHFPCFWYKETGPTLKQNLPLSPSKESSLFCNQCLK